MSSLGIFKADLKTFTRKVNSAVVILHKKLTVECFTRIVNRTPVDLGAARASWALGINREVIVDTTDKNYKRSKAAATAEALNRELPKLGRLKTGDTTIIANDLSYIRCLEEGSSIKSPNGMVGITVAELKSWKTEI